jgi:cytoskeletal protein CcmA (bactofilin family)
MTHSARFCTLCIFTMLWLFLIFNGAYSTQFKSVDNFFFPDTSTIHDDLVIAGGNIKLDGTIEGDLISASRYLVQNGVVTGSLNSAAQNLEILGVVNGSMRGFAQNINVNGQLNQNLITFCSSLNIRSDANIAKDVTVFAGELTLDGKVGGDLKGSVGNLIISGEVGRDVSITADNITLMPTARVLGNFKYKSAKQAKIESGATISGETTWTKKVSKKESKSAFSTKSLITKTLFLLALMITGIVLSLLCKQNAHQAKKAVAESFLKTMGLGFIFIICIPIAIIILLITVIGIPLAIISLFAYLILIYIAKIPVAAFLGDRIIKALGKEGEPSFIGSMILGLIVLTILLNIPYLKWLIYFVVLFTGFGAILLSQKRSAS